MIVFFIFLAKQGILRGFPDVGKIAEKVQLSKESTKEQSTAKLTAMSQSQKIFLQDLNRRYKEKFNFPFVICARLNKFESIIKGLEDRYGNDVDQEVENGIQQALKICDLRIKDVVHVAPLSML